ncbi:helix-turn-helix domain-containing protein [Streptomyces sp. NPDC013457]|uniref:helix-turn-helix domain-containing protein n=1 Tax=Streptomyces sp. NPDC013457 TaxID=3364866 RepID=UPI0036FE45FC
METPAERDENLAQLIKRIRDTYNVSESEIARRIGVAPATVNSWTLGKRGGKRGPNPDKLRGLAREFPKFTEAEIFAAARREAPGPLDDEAEKRLVSLFRGLTEEQQRAKLIEMSALNEANKQ